MSAHRRLATHRLPGLVLTGHEIEVPLDPARPELGEITVFGREVVSAERADEDLPWLVFLQGGPGFEAPRPTGPGGWLGRALREFRVLLLDQRGTGRSTPVGFQQLGRLPSPEAQAEYLSCFRADAIVRDAEAFRRALLGEGGRWVVLGQSFGGFCLAHYLCAHPEGLAGGIFTGGIPPIGVPIDDVYRATFRLTLERNERYARRYPEDGERVERIRRLLAEGDVRLLRGDRLSVRRFQQLGHSFGMSDGFEPLHDLLERAFVPGTDDRELAYSFLVGVENAQSFDTNPIYALLHEACYADGFATRWSAERVRAEFPEFDPEGEGPLRFTGEMIFPWMFEEYGALRPLREAAERLARMDWPRLYDVDALGRNDVPCAAAVYHDDMYVVREFSLAAARGLPRLELWITNEYEHNALRADGERLLDRLLERLRDA